MKGKFSSALSLALIVAMLVTSLALADQVGVDNDVVSPGNQSSVSLTVAPGATVTTNAQLVINYLGNSHLVAGSGLVLQVGTNDLPTGYSVTEVFTSVPNPWNSSVNLFVAGISSITFTAPTTPNTYVYTVKWDDKTKTCTDTKDCVSSGNAFTINLTVSAPSNTSPTVTVTGVTDGASYEFGSVPAAVCEVTDAEDGNSSFAATLSAITGPLAAYGLGDQTASCSYTDDGGLSDSDSATYSIVDTTAPTITFVSRTPPANTYGWNNTDVTVNWSCSDNVDVVSTSVSQTLTAEGANLSATGTCTDLVGLTASDTQTGINIDKTAPVITFVSPSTSAWYKEDVPANWSCSDATSGAVSSSVSAVASGEGLAIPATGTCTDKAGNTASDTQNFKIDKTAPVVTVTGVTDDAQYTLGSVPAAGCSTTDALSGVATNAGLSLSGGPVVGFFTATCSGAFDNAGNAGNPASVTYQVIYAWNGFFQPIDNGENVWNTVKAGSAVPVKFSLGGDQGLSIFATGYPKLFKVSCTGGTEDAIESTVTAGGSSLTYDALAGQYIYVWKTDKSWANTITCGRLYVTLIDGTTHSANFKFK